MTLIHSRNLGTDKFDKHAFCDQVNECYRRNLHTRSMLQTSPLRLSLTQLTLSDSFASRVVRALGQRRGCPRLSERGNRLVVKSRAGVGIPGGAHKPGLRCGISDSPSSRSSVKMLIHDCWFVSLALRSTPALIINEAARLSFGDNSLSYQYKIRTISHPGFSSDSIFPTFGHFL